MNGASLTLLAAMASESGLLPLVEALRYPLALALIGIALVIRCGANFGRRIETMFVKVGPVTVGGQPIPAEGVGKTLPPPDEEGPVEKEDPFMAWYVFLSSFLIPSTKAFLALLAHLGESPESELEPRFLGLRMGTAEDFKAAWMALKGLDLVEVKRKRIYLEAGESRPAGHFTQAMAMPTDKGRHFLRFLARSAT